MVGCDVDLVYRFGVNNVVPEAILDFEVDQHAKYNSPITKD